MKKCMEYRVEGRRPVGRPRKTWLKSAEADMAELNCFSTMDGSISVSISLDPFLSSIRCMGFVIDSIFSLVKTELKELFRIFALFLSSKLNSPCLSINGDNLSLVQDFVLTYAKNDLESLFMLSANFLSNFSFDLLASFV